MKIKIDNKELKTKLNKLKKITDTKTNFSILSNVRIEASETGIIFQGTNMDTAITVNVTGEVIRTGSVTVEQTKLYQLVSKAKDDVILTLKNDVCMLNIDIGKANYDVIALRDDDFPKIVRSIDSEHIITLNFAQHINDMHYIFKAVEGIGQYGLENMYIEVEKTGAVNIVCIDGRRMIVNHEQILNDKQEEYNFMLPFQLIDIIKSNKETEDCIISLDDDNIVLEYNDTVYHVKNKKDLKFPNWRLFVPKETVNNFSCNRRELIEKMELLKPMLDSESTRMTVECNCNKIHLQATNNEYGKGNAEIKADINIKEKQDKTIGFSLPLLEDILKHETGDNVIFAYNNSLSQVCINGKDRVIMPMKIQ